MTGYLPWYLGALALGSVGFGYWFLERRYLGVSGAFTRVLNWREEAEAWEAETALAATDEDALTAALLAETEAAFGALDLPDAEVGAAGAATPGSEPPAGAEPPPPALAAPLPAARARPSAHLAFLLMLLVGGLVGALIKGGVPVLTFDPGADFTAALGGGARGFALLAAGGLLVGFGTRLAGGCTSGHGLSGCARVQPASLASTATFLGVAIAVAHLIDGLAR